MASQRRNQRNECFSRGLCLRFGIHRILESKSDSAVEKILHGCLREKMQPNLASYAILLTLVTYPLVPSEEVGLVPSEILEAIRPSADRWRVGMASGPCPEPIEP